MRSWFVVYTRPREEQVAAEHLSQQGFEVYWPRYRKTVRHARSIRGTVASLFPRYIFASFDPDETGWRAIRSTRGVVDLICHGVSPAKVSPNLISEIKSREDRDGYVLIGRQAHLVEGKPIRLQHKAFSEHDLIFQSLTKDNERVTALLRLLGCELEIQVPVSAVAPV